MPLFDLPLDELRRHVTSMVRPADLDDFWAQTLQQARASERPALFTPYQTPLRSIDVYDVTFTGFGGRPVKAWLLLPVRLEEPVPCVVQYVGYGGGRGLPNQWLAWPAAGYATFVMDNRGQGGDSYAGDTADFAVQDVHAAGFLTHGILDPSQYYYRRLFTDAVLAIDAAASHSYVNRIVLAGSSQGGALSIAAAALSERPDAALPDVPFLCDVQRGSLLSSAGPLPELATYLHTHPRREAQVFNTLTYFDGAVLAAQATAPALFSVGLMDQVCPPSTVYAAYNAWAGPKEIETYTYAGHDGGGPLHLDMQMTFIAETVAKARSDHRGDT